MSTVTMPTPRLRRPILGVCFLLVLFASVVLAEDSTPTTEGQNQEEPAAEFEAEVLVTSTLPELATEISVPGRRLVEAGSGDVVEFLRQLNGSSAVRRGPINLDVVVRGLQEDQVGTFVDGTRTFAAGPARMDSNLSHIGPHVVQNVKVVKGPYALSWGAGTLSAIEIDTFRPSFTRNLEVHGGLRSSYSENASVFDNHAAVWISNEHWRAYVSGGERSGDDYEDGNGTPVPGDFDSSEFRWRLDYRPNDAWLLEYSGGYQEQNDIDYPGRLLDATYFYARSQSLELTWQGGQTVSEVYGQLYSNRKDHLMNNDEKPTAQPNPNRIPPFAIDVVLPTESNTSGGRFHAKIDGGALDWTFGVDGYRVEQSALRTVSRRSNAFVLFEDIVWPDAEIEDLGGYAQLIHRGEDFQLGATLRLDTVDASADQLSPFFVDNTVGDPNQSETNFSAAVSAIFEIGEHWAWNIGAGRAVRTANVLERYSDRFPATRFQIAAEFMGNPLLDPEESLEANLGARASYGNFVFEIEGFYRIIDNYITIEADPSLSRRLPLSPTVVYRYINGTEANFWGGELSLLHRPHSNWSWRGSLAYVRADDELFDEPVLGIAPLGGELGVRYAFLDQRWWIDAEIEFADRQDRVATSRFEQETPGYAIYNLSTEFSLNPNWTLRAGVDNLGDRAYAQHLNAPNPFTGERILEIGRSIRFGVDFTF